MVIKFPYIFQGSLTTSKWFCPKEPITGPVRESNPGPLAPKARIMPLDQQAGDVKYGLGRVFYSLLLLERVD